MWDSEQITTSLMCPSTTLWPAVKANWTIAFHLCPGCYPTLIFLLKCVSSHLARSGLPYAPRANSNTTFCEVFLGFHHRHRKSPFSACTVPLKVRPSTSGFLFVTLKCKISVGREQVWQIRADDIQTQWSLFPKQWILIRKPISPLELSKCVHGFLVSVFALWQYIGGLGFLFHLNDRPSVDLTFTLSSLEAFCLKGPLQIFPFGSATFLSSQS